MIRNCIKCGIQEDTSEGTFCHNYERHSFLPIPEPPKPKTTTTIWVVLEKQGDYILDNNDDEDWEYTNSVLLRAFHDEASAIAFKNSVVPNDDREVKSCELE